eukprot:COSAG06_NODE_4088_length_4587_cov_16.117157_5_plen_570_part_00
MLAYEGALSWSAILGATDQGTVLSFIQKYTELSRTQLQKAAAGDARAAGKTRNDLRLLCGPPPVKTPSLARIRSALSKTDVAAFDALGVDSAMLGHEFVLMVQRFPEHFDDAQFLCEQLFRKITVEDLVESADEKQRRRSSSEARGSETSSSFALGPSSKTLSTAPGAAGRGNSRGSTWVDGSDFEAQQARRGSSASSRASSAGSAGAHRRRSSTSSGSASGRRRSGSTTKQQPSKPSLGPDVRALPDPNWAPVVTEPLTPRRGSEQSIEEFEREMDTFLEQKRRNSSCEASAVDSTASSAEAPAALTAAAPAGPGAVHPSQHGGPPTPKAAAAAGKLMYVGAASKGGSFLPPLPTFDSSSQRRRSSGSSSSSSSRSNRGGGGGGGCTGGVGSAAGGARERRTDRRPHSSTGSRSHRRRHSGSSGGSSASEDEEAGGDVIRKPRRRRSDSGPSSSHSRSEGGPHSSSSSSSSSSSHRRGSAGGGHGGEQSVWLRTEETAQRRGERVANALVHIHMLFIYTIPAHDMLFPVHTSLQNEFGKESRGEANEPLCHDTSYFASPCGVIESSPV